jgi:hypothetical protein
MKVIDDLLGFAVLTGPLWLILILLPVCIWLAIKIAKRFKPGITRLAGGVGIFLLLFALPFGDEIAGRIYLSYLCSTQAGVKVYQTVELPAEYWVADGKPKFYDEKNGNFHLPQIGTDFKTEEYSSAFPIKKFRLWYFEKQNEKILGEITEFSYAGGWVSRNFNPAPGGGVSCERTVLQSSREITLAIFRPKIPSQAK